MSVVDLDPDRTIVAIASPIGPAIRGIVRLSGPRTLDCINRLCKPTIDEPHVAQWFSVTLRVEGISSPVSSTVLVWPDQRSYTRQPSAEIHLVGSPPIVEGLVESLCRNGATMARPGEFTLRAFLAGRLDLSQAEAVIGAVEASGESEFALALAQGAGGMRDPLDRLRHELLELLAHVEAGLDFVDEDIQFIAPADLEMAIHKIHTVVQNIIQQISARSLLSDGWRVTLIGRPNAGKSSLFNALLGRSAAIATAIAGTTRDYLTESLTLNGFSIKLIDTAGLEPGELDQTSLGRPQDGSQIEAIDKQVDSIRKLAQMQTQDVITQSHLQLLCVERTLEPNEWERQRIREAGDHLLWVATKADLERSRANGDGIPVSSVTGQGLDELKLRICERLQLLSEQPTACSATVARCSEPLALADAALCRAADGLRDQAGDELIAAELRVALEQLGRIVGAVYSDDILDRIFSRFCIGK